jgi:hypothetical protein
LEAIMGLEAALKEKDALLKKTIEEMKFFKLELLNREENFNQRFGVGSPNVGVLDPLASKGKAATGGAAAKSGSFSAKPPSKK